MQASLQSCNNIQLQNVLTFVEVNIRIYRSKKLYVIQLSDRVYNVTFPV